MTTTEHGFTLLEVLCAMAIFAVAMLGVIGLQMSAIVNDEETRRKDMASQLLTAGVEMVECTDYGATEGSEDLFRSGNTVSEAGFGAFLAKVSDNPDSISNPWLSWGNGKARLFLRHQVVDTDVDADGDIDFSVRNVFLVAAWESIKTGDTQTLSRIVVKPKNQFQ